MSLFVKALAAPFKLYHSIADEVAKERRLRLTDGAAWSTLFGRQSHAGKIVTMSTAMQVATAWACIKLTAQAISSLPIKIYEKRSATDRVEIDDDEVGAVIADDPNRDQTPLEFWEEMAAWLVTRGNAYAERVHVGRTLSALTPIASTHCHPVRENGELVYRITDRGQTETWPRDKVFHVKGFGQGLENRDLGLSPIAYGTNTLGAAIAAEEVAGNIFSNGLLASMMLSADQPLDDAQSDQVQKIIEKFVGSTKAGKALALPYGLKAEKLTLNPDDAQLLETRRFSIEEICRWFGVPPVIIGHAAEGQTMWGSGVEQIMISWLTLGLDPLCDRIEARIKKQLLRPAGNRRRYAEFNREALLQMDSTAKSAFLSTMVQNALMTRNEGRAKLNYPRSNSPVADELTAQTNLAPLDRLGAASDSGQARAALRAWLGFDDQPAKPAKGSRNEQA
jgi:HK97 family phage portal protein